MNFASVDAAIAENLVSKGHIFCPNLNKLIAEAFIDKILISGKTHMDDALVKVNNQHAQK